MIKRFFFIIFIILYSGNIFSYTLPDSRNKSIVNKVFEEDEFIYIEDYNYIPYSDIINLDSEILESPFDFVIHLLEEGNRYREIYNFIDLSNIKISKLYIDLKWIDPITNYFMSCVQPEKNNDECNGDVARFDNMKKTSKYFYKGNFYSIKYRDLETNEYCRGSRFYTLTTREPIGPKYLIDIYICSQDKQNAYVNNTSFSETTLKSLKIGNNKNIFKIKEDIKNKKISNKKELNKEEQRKAEEKRKEEKKEAEEKKKKEAERQKKLEEKKKELEEKRKQEEEKRRIEEELRKEAEEKKRKQEEERKKREAEEKRKKELQKNIQDTKSALSVAKRNQNKLITETKNLELQLREIKSANTINNVDNIMEITNKIYDTTQTYIKSFDVNYERVERLFNKNPETELNLIFNEFKLLNTQINNQKNEISKIYMEIFDIHTSKKTIFEKELRDKQLTDAFMRSDQAYIYTYVPIGVAIVLLLILLWRWNSSGRQIAYLNNKIRDLEKNNEQSTSPTTQVSKSIDKTEKQDETITTSIKTPEKNNIKEEEEEEKENKNIEEPISNEIEKLNNLIDDKTFMDKYQNALSDLNSLRSFTDEFKVKGLERFSSQRVEDGVELEISQRIVDKAMFWLIEHPQTFELLILPARDLWSRSRLLLQDTSRFGYLNFNGIFDLSEGEEFKLINFAIVSVTDKKKYKIEQKGEVILPKSN